MRATVRIVPFGRPRLLRDRFVRLHSDLPSRVNGGVRCLGHIGGPSKSRRQKIHGIEYVETRVDLSAECAGPPIFNVGETMFRSGENRDRSRRRRALSRPGSRFYLILRAKSSRCPRVALSYTRASYIAVREACRLPSFQISLKLFYSQRTTLA